MKIFEKDLTKPRKNKIPTFPKPYRRKQKNQSGLLKAMIFEHG